MPLSQEYIITTLHAVSSIFKRNEMISKVASKVVASCGILKNGTITRECITEKNLIGISKRKIKKKTIRQKKTQDF